jgi:hypothetical protein
MTKIRRDADLMRVSALSTLPERLLALFFAVKRSVKKGPKGTLIREP